MNRDARRIWRLSVQLPNCEPVLREVLAPSSLEELCEALEVSDGEVLLATHRRHSKQQFLVERVDQLQDGAALEVRLVERRIFVSRPPSARRRPVSWCPGTSTEEIERLVAAAAGLAPGQPFELRDGEGTVALSASIPNDTSLEVVPCTGRIDQCVSRSRAAKTPASPSNSKRGDRQQNGRPSVWQQNKMKVQNGERPLGDRYSEEKDGYAFGSRLDAGGHSEAFPTGHSAWDMEFAGAEVLASKPEVPEEHCEHILAGHSGHITCICAVEGVLFTGGQDSDIMIWDLSTLTYIGTLPGHRGSVRVMSASYGSKVLLSGSEDRTLRVWSLDTFRTEKTLYGHAGAVTSILIMEQSGSFMSGSEDRTIRVWSLQEPFDILYCVDKAHVGGVSALVTLGSPAGAPPGAAAVVVSGARDRSLKVWDPDTWVARSLHPPHYDGVTSIAVASQRQRFYSASRDRSIKEWDLISGSNVTHALHVHGDWITSLVMSESEDVLFSASRDSTIKAWDANLTCLAVLRGHRGAVTGLSCVGGRLLSSSFDRTVRVWRVDHHG